MGTEIAVSAPFSQIQLSTLPREDGMQMKALTAQDGMTGVQVSIVFDPDTWEKFMEAANGQRSGLQIASPSDLSKLDGKP